MSRPEITGDGFSFEKYVIDKLNKLDEDFAKNNSETKRDLQKLMVDMATMQGSNKIWSIVFAAIVSIIITVIAAYVKA